MATADELLSGSSTEVDKILVIDNDLRRIIVPSTLPVLGVESDDDVLRLKFKMPRYVSDTDLSTFSIRINYYNANDEGDLYTVSDAEVISDYITFSWRVGPVATSVKGMTRFNVCAVKLDANGNVDKEFNTEPVAMEVREGLKANEKAVTLYSDVIEQWRQELFGIGDTEEASIRAVSKEQQTIIENKGAEVLATIPADYTVTHSMANEGVRSKADAIICSAQGEPIAVSDSSDDYLRGLKIFGKTTQVATTGKNLLNCATISSDNIGDRTYKFEYDDNGSLLSVTVSGVDDGYTFVGYDVTLPAGTYIVTGCPEGGAIDTYNQYICDRTNSVDYGYDTGHGAEFTLADTTEIRVYVGRVRSNVTVPELTFRPMIRLASVEDDTYEPYTGGIAAPNPEYPQDLASVENPSIRVLGKNLVDIVNPRRLVNCTTETDGNRLLITRTNTSAVYSNVYYSLGAYNSFVGKKLAYKLSNKSAYAWILRIGNMVSNALNDTDSIVTIAVPGNDVTSGVITIPYNVNGEDLGIRIVSWSNDIADDTVYVLEDIQVEIGDAATDYEDYTPVQVLTTEYTLPGIPVSSGGNYTDPDGRQWICDEIDFERGVYVQRIRTMSLPNDFKLNTDNEMFSYISHRAPADMTAIQCLCTHFSARSRQDIFINKHTSNYRGVSVNDNVIRIADNTLFDGNVDSLNAWIDTLADNTLSYILATPIETPLTTAELLAFKNLRSNYPNTTVLNDAGATMELKYNADTEIWINNLIDSKISAALANL